MLFFESIGKSSVTEEKDKLRKYLRGFGDFKSKYTVSVCSVGFVVFLLLLLSFFPVKTRFCGLYLFTKMFLGIHLCYMSVLTYNGSKSPFLSISRCQFYCCIL